MAIREDNRISRETTPRTTPKPKISRERFHQLVRWFSEQSGIAPQLAIAAQAVSWFLEVDAFREMEEIKLVDGSYEASLADQRAFLSELISDGENLVCRIKKHGMAADKLPFTLEDVQATVESLHTTFRCEHGPKNSEKTNQLIAELFDAPQS